MREAIEMITPVEGIVFQHFDARQQIYGIKITTAAQAEVAAVEGAR